MNKKYTPHIRIPFKLFDDLKIKKIPKKHRPSTLLVLITLLKFVNSETGQCYPRQNTISSMTSLSRSTIYRCTQLLIKVGIIKKKRLRSSLLYLITPEYIVNKKLNVSLQNPNVSPRPIECVMMTDISRTNIKLTNIDNLIKKISNNGGDQNQIINELATLPPDTLKEAISNNDNPYYCKLALNIQPNKIGKLVDLPSQKELLTQLQKKN